MHAERVAAPLPRTGVTGQLDGPRGAPSSAFVFAVGLHLRPD